MSSKVEEITSPLEPNLNSTDRMLGADDYLSSASIIYNVSESWIVQHAPHNFYSLERNADQAYICAHPCVKHYSVVLPNVTFDLELPLELLQAQLIDQYNVCENALNMHPILRIRTHLLPQHYMFFSELFRRGESVTVYGVAANAYSNKSIILSSPFSSVI